MKKSLLVLLNIILLFFFISCSSSNFNPEKDKQVLWEACEIPPPPKTKKMDDGDIIKSHAGVVTKFYSHESGCPAVENHYETVLNNRGWEKVPWSFFSNFDDNRFKKGDVTISLNCEEIRSLRGIKRFSIDCSKGLH
jgi:hypothetical protein